MNYLGDFPTGATVYVYFHTFNSSGASVTITGLATSDIEIYKNGSTTQRSSDAGYTLLDTDGIDFDSLTGIHGFSIDLSDNTDAGFYAAGNEYTVVVSSITADSQTVSFVAASFSIERSGGALALLKAGSVVVASVTAGVTLANDAITAAKFDESTAFPLASADSGATQVARVGADGDTLETLSDQLDTITTDTNELQTDWTDGGRLDLIVDAILADTNELQTDDTPAALATIEGKIDTVDGIVDDILVDTAEIGIAGAGLTEAGGTGDHLASIPWNAAWDAEVESEATDALNAYDPPTNAEMEARTLAAADYFDPAADTVATVTSVTNQVTADVTAISGDSAAADNAEAFFDGTGYAGTNNVIPTVTTLTGHTAQTGDNYARLGAPAGVSVSADIAAVKADTNATLTDTNELQGDWTDGGRLDLIIDAVLEDTGTTLPASISGLNDLSAAQVNAEVVDVLRTDTIPDSYSADGAQPTIAQAVLAILQFLTEKAVSGTTVTVKKPDGSTSAMTFTLDDATDPTSITRAS